MTSLPVRFIQNQSSRKFYRFGLLLVSALLVLGALVLPIALRPSSLPVQLGDVAPQTFVASKTLTYESAVLTQNARATASNAIADRYLPMDISISRSQIKNMQAMINKISLIRSDKSMQFEHKFIMMLQFENLTITQDAINQILQMSAQEWEVVSQEAISALERSMRNTIRNYQVQEVRYNLPSLISYTLPDRFVYIVDELASPFIVENSLLSDKETDAARQQAMDAVQPITRTYVQNQTIALKGQIITEEQMEALQLFGLIKPANKIQDLIAAGSIVIVLTGFILLYFTRRQVSPMGDLKSLTVIALGFLLFLYGARFLIPNRAVIPYFFPISAYALILVTLFNLEIGIIFSLALSILASFGLSNSLDLTIFYMISSIIAALAIGRGRRISSFFVSAIAISVASSLVLVAYKLTDPLSDLVGLFTLIGVSFLNGVASASLALLIQYILSQALGLVTPIYLLEISRPDHPLLKFLLQNAPGTYQHSLQVSNLAEQAAEAIGADALLTRVGTLYHDIGKAVNAPFFVENQIPGKLNTHEDLDSVIAAQIIIQHVQDGVNLANKHRLPARIKEFIREHHGTQFTRYQYNRALEKAQNDPSKVDKELFRYPGPKPRSKETALVMLADGCEARARAELPKTPEELERLVKAVFDYCLKEGQFDKTSLTLKDMKTAQESFIYTLSNTYHPRIKYPENISEKTEKV
ncbi:MAG: HD family phosphohydrolase [Anaerolineaceae bacterium]